MFSETGRLAISHLRPSYLSESQKSNAKFILGIRNPKDAAVSMFHHFRKDLGIQLQATWDQFFELFTENQGKTDIVIIFLINFDVVLQINQKHNCKV